jgi:alkylation response protein AidB-like acyl-CoA dehydrogenase
MDFKYTAEEEAFRAEVAAFVEENSPEDKADFLEMLKWNAKLREKRWVGFSWPKEVGGGGGGIMQQVILKEEMAKRKAPPLGVCYMGLTWVGPAIIEYGTDEQKQRFIPDILDGKVQWCTGYSEPDAGSDLATLKCKCVREGDEYVVNGQKTWTSIAMWSQWVILLVRTQTDVAVKHEGITCLLVSLQSPGIEIRPIKNMSGGEMFAEVSFDNVRVPVENRLGEEGLGWQVTISALAHERSGIAEFYGMMRNLESIVDLARRCTKNGRPAIEDPGIRRRIVKAETTIEAMRLSGLRFLTKQLKGQKLGSETSINKLHRANLEIELGELAAEIQGSAGALWQGAEPVKDGGKWQYINLSWPEVVIGGGTPNIQKNIIAERILGLPKD